MKILLGTENEIVAYKKIHFLLHLHLGTLGWLHLEHVGQRCVLIAVSKTDLTPSVVFEEHSM